MSRPRSNPERPPEREPTRSAPRHGQAMTPVPQRLPAGESTIGSKSLKLLKRSSVARFVLVLGANVLSALPSALPLTLLGSPLLACVVPPALQLDEPDAGENAAPIITSIIGSDAKELVEPGPVSFDRGRGTLSISLRDADVTDELFVRVYVDYNKPDPTPARASCSTAPSEVPSRSTSCNIAGVCTTADIGMQRLLWIEVFDRELLQGGMPLFRATAGGFSSKWQFTLICEEPQ